MIMTNTIIPRVLKAEVINNTEGALHLLPRSGEMMLRLQLVGLTEAEQTYTALCYDSGYTLMGQTRFSACGKGKYAVRRTLSFRSIKPWRAETYTVVLLADEVPFTRVDIEMSVWGTAACRVAEMNQEEPLHWMVRALEHGPHRHRWNTVREFGGVRDVKLRLADLHHQWVRLESDEMLRSTEVMLFEGDRHLHAARVALSCTALLKTGKGEEHKINCDSVANDKLRRLLRGSGVRNELLVFYHAGKLAEPRFKDFMPSLLTRMANPMDGSLFVFCDGTTELKKLFRVYPQVKELVSEGMHLRVQPRSVQETTDLMLGRMWKQRMRITSNPTDRLEAELEQAVLEHNADYDLACLDVEEIDHYVATMFASCPSHFVMCEDGQAALEVGQGDLLDLGEYLQQNPPKFVSAGQYMRRMRQNFASVMAELNDMVGLAELKAGMEIMLQQLMFNKLRSDMGLPSDNTASHHMLFVGNPGTGKTSVAKLMGKVFKMLGILSDGEVVVADRKELVRQYIGETEEHMKEVLESARGKVLFIDEAYSLFSDTDGRKDCGYRVIESLLPVMAEPNPNMVVIMAGYERGMEHLLAANQGLKSRFSHTWHFADYTADELHQIACNELQRQCFCLDTEADRCLSDLCRRMVVNKDRDFANARWVKQVVCNGMLPAMAQRVMTAALETDENLLTIIRKADVQHAARLYGPKENPTTRRIGFCA